MKEVRKFNHRSSQDNRDAAKAKCERLRARSEAARAKLFVELRDATGTLGASVLRWADELDTKRQRIQVRIDLKGGLANVWVLHDQSGQPVRARVVNGKYGPIWQILNSIGKPTGKILPYRPRNQARLHSQGFTEVKERRPAVAMILFDGSGGKGPRVEAVIAIGKVFGPMNP